MVNTCILCLEHPTIPGPKFLELFSEEGLRLEISNIINKHFWLKTYRNGEEPQRICMTCWEIVRDFHILYSRVEDVHKHLEMKTIEIDDPLPLHDDVVMLKSETTPVPMLQDPIMGNTCLSDNPFDSEVKVEVNDLDLLPQIEILESAPDLPTTTKSLRRIRNTTGREQSPRPTQSKRIKKEPVPAIDIDDEDNDYDVFARNDMSAEDIVDPEQFLSSALDVQHTVYNFIKETKAKRGRPRKSDAEKAKAAAALAVRKKAAKKSQKDAGTIKNESKETEEPSCSTAQKSEDIPHIKTEQPTDETSQKATETATESATISEPLVGQAGVKGEDFTIPQTAEEFEDDFDNNDNDNDYAAKDSDESSNSDSDSGDNSEASDWAPGQEAKSDKFAVIVKKERRTPKKYKKRDKPPVEPKRMSKEDIAARNAQQAEYDDIITKFFEKIRCPKCELLVHTFGDMRAHFRLDHNDDHGFVECCGRRFATRKSLAEHIMVHYNPEHFKCKTCDKICRDSTQLEVHEQTHLPNPPEGKSKKTFQCEKCSKTFSSKASFEHHMVAKHVPREEFKFECPECKKKFPSKKRLYYHRKHHNPNQDVVCDICGKIVRTANTLNKHMAAVHGPKAIKVPQQCKYCDKWYSTRGTLSTHVLNMHVHAGKEHRCEICGFVSSSRDGKAKHKRFKHCTVKKYKCSICEKAFKVPTLLREHLAIHTGVDLYKCDYCTATFKSKSNRSNHCKRNHPVEYVANRKVRSRPSAIQPLSTITEELDIERSSPSAIQPFSTITEELDIESFLN